MPVFIWCARRDQRTVNVTVLVIPFKVAVMLQVPVPSVPSPTPVAMPRASMVATVVSLEVQVTEPEILPVVLFENVPVAVKVVVLPLPIDIVAGVIAMLCSVASVTVMLAAGEVMVPYNEGMAAVMLVVPTATPVTKPVLLPTLAVPGATDVHVTKVVRSAVVPFE